MVINLERRIKKLEGVLPNRQFMSMVPGVLREIGYEELATRIGVGVPRILLRAVDDTDISISKSSAAWCRTKTSGRPTASVATMPFHPTKLG